jgi:hypothetical protein
MSAVAWTVLRLYVALQGSHLWLQQQNLVPKILSSGDVQTLESWRAFSRSSACQKELFVAGQSLNRPRREMQSFVTPKSGLQDRNCKSIKEAADQVGLRPTTIRGVDWAAGNRVCPQ